MDSPRDFDMVAAAASSDEKWPHLNFAAQSRPLLVRPSEILLDGIFDEFVGVALLV